MKILAHRLPYCAMRHALLADVVAGSIASNHTEPLPGSLAYGDVAFKVCFQSSILISLPPGPTQNPSLVA
jgi:hypothetical protein